MKTLRWREFLALVISIGVDEADGQSWAVVRVQDQGIGIPPADLPHIFERFRRASNVMRGVHGLGLGLASVLQIVEQHGGRVTAANALDGGSLFTVRLPLGAAATGGARASAG